MGEFIFEYGVFLAKAVTVVAAIGAILMLIAGFSRRSPAGGTGLIVEKINDNYRDLSDALQRRVMSKADWKKQSKKGKKERKKSEKSAAKSDSPRKRIFVLDFKGDIRASGVANLREEINAVVSVAGNDDEVVLRLENYGGAVHEHGLAASQLQRIKDRQISLTIIVDKVAASGGYLMACIADRIIAAPFSVIGSIGVLAQIPNFNRALEARGVDFEQITAGKYKRTVTMFGKNTDEDRAKLKEELEDVHELFKELVADQRPQLDLNVVATGEHWYGKRAMDLGLVDELGSSDDYLLDAVSERDVFKVQYRAKQTLQEKLLSSMAAIADRVELWFSQVRHERQFRDG